MSTYKQPPNAPRPDRRGRAIQMLTVSNVPFDVLETLDKLAASQDRSRSNFIRRELQQAILRYRARAV